MYKKIALICLSIAVFSIAEAKEVLDKVVALINNEVITSSELNKHVELAKKEILAQKMQLPEEPVLRKKVLQHLIDVDLQLQMAKQHGLTIDDKELDQAIEKIATLNHATLTQLREEIIKQGIGWNEYRENIRKEMILSRLQQKAVGKDVVVSNEQVEHYLKTEGGIVDQSAITYHLQNIVIPLNDEPKLEELSKAKKRAEEVLLKAKKEDDFNRLAIENSTNEFTLESGDLGERHLVELPELFAKEVIKMKVGQVVGPLRAGNGFQLIKLVSIGGIQQNHIITKTHVRHILLKPDPSMLSEDVKKQINNLYRQLKAGKDFSKIARKYSLDSVSAVKGGDLGWVSPHEVVPEFEKAMDKLAINEIGKPIKSQFGWHIIQVLGRKQEDDSEAFKKQQVRHYLQQKKFSEVVQNWQQHIRADAYVKIIEKDLA